MDRDLRAFIAIAEAQNLTAAAERVAISQPSLTKKLRLIEKDYGGKLFERLPRGMKLTPLGACLYRHAKRIETDYGRAREELRAITSGHLDILRVGAGATFHLLHISKIFDQLRREFPKTRLMLEAASNQITLPKLLEGELDVFVGQIQPIDEDKQLHVRRIATFEHCVALRRKHEFRAKRKLSAADLKDYSWIGYSGGTEPDSMLIEFFRASGLAPPELVVCMTSFASALQLVASGKYAMIVPGQLKPIVEAAGAVVCRLNAPLDHFEAGIYMRRTSVNYPIVRRFSEILDSIFRER
jgi:DNA-binding transcriptional LysR family regulator